MLYLKVHFFCNAKNQNLSWVHYGTEPSHCRMILHVHKEHTGELSLVNIADSFVNSEQRMTLFGTFSEVYM